MTTNDAAAIEPRLRLRETDGPEQRTPARRRAERRARNPRLYEALQPAFVVSALVVVAVVVAAFLPGVFSADSPYQTHVTAKFLAPSLDHPLGTDSLGRDQYARFVHGTANTLIASLLAVGIGFVFSAVLGIAAGYFRGWVDEIVSRVVDVFLAVPGLLVSLLIVTALGFGRVNIAVAVGIGSIAYFTRILRSEVLKARESDFIAAAQVNGLPWWKVLIRHVFPHTIGPIVALVPLAFGEAILAVSALSFLGFGVQPPEPEWGALVSDGRNFLQTAPWLAVLPGVVIAIVVLSANRVSKYFERTL